MQLGLKGLPVRKERKVTLVQLVPWGRLVQPDRKASPVHKELKATPVPQVPWGQPVQPDPKGSPAHKDPKAPSVLLARQVLRERPELREPQVPQVTQVRPVRKAPRDLLARLEGSLADWSFRATALSSCQLESADCTSSCMVPEEAELFCDAITEEAEVAAPTRARSWRSKKVKP